MENRPDSGQSSSGIPVFPGAAIGLSGLIPDIFNQRAKNF
jgi:hypothetical protein